MNNLSRRTAFAITLIGLLAVSLACGQLPSKGDTLVEEGVEAYNAKDYEAARDKLLAALDEDLNQNEPETVYAVLGHAYENLDQLDEAIAAHKKSIEINPEFATGWTNLGIAYRMIGDYDEAEKAYNRALELDPNSSDLYASMGALEIARGNPEKGITLLQKAIELDPDQPISHSNLAIAYAMLGRFEEADAELARAIELGYENGQEVQDLIDEQKANQ